MSFIAATAAVGLSIIGVQPAVAATDSVALTGLTCSTSQQVESRAFVTAYHYQRHISSTIRIATWPSTNPPAYRFAKFGYKSVTSVSLYSDQNMTGEARYCTAG
jgi:hypothetical protein